MLHFCCLTSFWLEFVCCVLVSSCVPYPDYLYRRQHDQVWDLGHSRTGALSQSCTDVLPRSTSCHYCLRYHESGTDFDLSQSSVFQRLAQYSCCPYPCSAILPTRTACWPVVIVAGLWPARLTLWASRCWHGTSVQIQGWARWKHAAAAAYAAQGMRGIKCVCRRLIKFLKLK